ncbi:MAG: 4Fe-4S dicluster domain-containing protein [Firmicutes bacterium]|nr:4Fe-4S dicluster domain-containing protein [Bacillota bacterium]
MVEMMISVDPERCTGCRMCEMACSLFHHGVCGPAYSRIRIHKVEDHGFSIPVVCQHCADAPCAAVCPPRALREDPATGAVACDDSACVGCRLCFLVCPVGAIYFPPPGGRVKILKCDLCGGDPQCVRVCEPEALRFIRVDQAHRYRSNALVEHYAASHGGKETDRKRGDYTVKV